MYDPLRSPTYVLRFLGLTVAFFAPGVAEWRVVLTYSSELLRRARVLDMDEAAQDVAAGGTTPLPVVDWGNGP